MMNRWAVTACLLLMTVTLGCSTLGLSTNPVAHTLTKDTKEVLENTSRNTAAVARELAKETLSSHYLEPGDELLIELNDIDTEIRIPADQQVFADGSVDLGEYGRVKVAGVTLEQAETRIHAAINKIETEPVGVNVRLIQAVHRYYVIGEVNSPGAYPLTGNETVLDGILTAGGLTLRASACDLLLARPTDPCSCRVTLPVCYRAITQLGDTTTNYQLKPGDRIFVGRMTLTEELLQCCCSPKTCERCCKQQQACCDPTVAPSLHPSFVPADVHMVPGSTGESDESSSDAVGSIEWQQLHVDSLPDEASSPNNVAPIDTPLEFTPRRDTEMLDGELDFDALNQQ